MSSLITTDLFQLAKMGLALQDMGKLEAMNSNPIPEGLLQYYPQLAYFSGLSLNIFLIREENGCFRLFPIGLSKNCRKTSHFHIDLIQITSSILVPGAITPNNHVLAAPFLSTLMTKFSGNRGHYSRICRSCCSVFSSTQALHAHFSVCSIDARKGSTSARKRSRNMFSHHPRKLNSFSGRLEPNGLKWRRSSNFKLCAPLCIGLLDTEAYNVPLPKDTGSIYERVPTGAQGTQSIMCYQYVFKSMYPDIPLSDDLAHPRIRFSPQTPESGDKELFISLFLSLRQDMLHHAEHLKRILKADVPPPPPHARDKDLLLRIAKETHCQICGKRFQSTSFSRRSKSHYVVKRAFDHDHYLTSLHFPQLMSNGTPIRAILCQGMLSLLHIVRISITLSISLT